MVYRALRQKAQSVFHHFARVLKNFVLEETCLGTLLTNL